MDQKNAHCFKHLSALAGPVDFAANLAFFLLEQCGTVYGRWAGRLTAAEQRGLFGRFLGKGTIVIDGAAETLCNRVKVCFGLDYDDRRPTRWADLGKGS